MRAWLQNPTKTFGKGMTSVQMHCKSMRSSENSTQCETMRTKVRKGSRIPCQGFHTSPFLCAWSVQIRFLPQSCIPLRAFDRIAPRTCISCSFSDSVSKPDLSYVTALQVLPTASKFSEKHCSLCKSYRSPLLLFQV